MISVKNEGIFFDIEKLIIQGDLSKLSPQDRVSYYQKVCETLGLNPFTKPFDYINLGGKLTLYARREATEQLRKIYNISIKISDRELIDDVYTVTAHATTVDGRSDESIGAVNLSGLKGEAKANALMKCETKAKRRVTLSICGLGMLDETEVSTIPNARFDKINLETGEIVSPKLEAVKSMADNIINKVKGSFPTIDMIDAQQTEFLMVVYNEFSFIKEGIDKYLEKLNLETISQLTQSQADKLIDRISEKHSEVMEFWSNYLLLKTGTEKEQENV